MKHLILLALVMSLLAAPDVRAAAEKLGQPCRAFNVLAGRAVKDPAGKEWFVLTNMNEVTGMELIFIDPSTGQGKSYRAPAGAGAWALIEVPEHRLVVGTYYDGTFMVFDLQKMEFVKSVKFPGEEYIWNFALGSDGRVYGGTYRGAKLGALDLKTYEVEDLGSPGAPNLYLRYVSATPDGRILCYFGMEKKITKLFDPKTKQFTDAPKHLQVERGVVWKDYFISGRQVMQGPDLKMVDPPFPTPKGEPIWSVDYLATTPQTLFMRQGDAVYRYREGDKDLTLMIDQPLRGGGISASDEAGNLLGVRGGEFFVLPPGKPIELRPIPVEPGPRQTHYLRFDAQRNRLWGGPTFGQTAFWLDVNSKKFENTAKVCDAGGEVYDAAFIDGKVYFVAYAGGDIVRYDPDQPWDQWNQKNPVTIASLTKRGYIRPVGGVCVGPDQKLYSGWMAEYGKYGGAVAITDPTSGETEVLENPLGVEQAVSGVAVGQDPNLLFIGTSLGGNGLPNKSGESPKFGVYDRKEKKAVFEKTFDGSSVSNLLFDAATGRVVMSVNGQIQIFDPKRNDFAPDLKLPKMTSHALSGRGDGRVYYAAGKTVYVLDLAQGKAVAFGDAPEKVEAITAGSKPTTVYVSCGVDVYRLTPDMPDAAP